MGSEDNLPKSEKGGISCGLYCRAVCITINFSESQNPRFIIKRGFKSRVGARTVIDAGKLLEQSQLQLPTILPLSNQLHTVHGCDLVQPTDSPTQNCLYLCSKMH